MQSSHRDAWNFFNHLMASCVTILERKTSCREPVPSFGRDVALRSSHTGDFTMAIDVLSYTPWTAVAGGVLIGLATAMFVLVNGRIASSSGILGGLLRPALPDLGWRVAFLAGLVVAPTLYGAFVYLPALKIDAGYGLLIGAGLLVGVGTRYAAGCTSGHGVCGLSRLSPRSVVATLLFTAAGFATVYVVRHLLHLS